MAFLWNVFKAKISSKENDAKDADESEEVSMLASLCMISNFLGG